MYQYKYPHYAITADCVLFGRGGNDGDLWLLLVERKNQPYKGCWAFPGGFMNPDETAEQCATRELAEETSLNVNDWQQVGTFSAVERDPRERVITVAFYAVVDKEAYASARGGDDACYARWFSLDSLPTLAFDHAEILDKALQLSGLVVK